MSMNHGERNNLIEIVAKGFDLAAETLTEIEPLPGQEDELTSLRATVAGVVDSVRKLKCN